MRISRNGGAGDTRPEVPEVHVTLLDLEAARRYFAGLEALAREARTSNDPRVLMDALAVVARQGKAGGRGAA